MIVMVGVSCIVKDCLSKSGKGKGATSFHQFPSAIELKEKWLCNIENGPGLRQTNPRLGLSLNEKSSVVCSLHFADNCYVSTMTGTRKRLDNLAVPTIFSRAIDRNEPSPAKRNKVDVDGNNNISGG